MKIVSWNCRGGFYSYEKYKNIRQLDADVYVISEINEPTKPDEEYKKFINNHYYLEFPSEKNVKGLAVIAKEDINLEKINWDYDKSQDFLAVRVEDKLDLIAVWTHHNYLNHMVDYLTTYKENFENSDNLVMCGDFNIDISLQSQKGKDEFNTLLNNYGYKSIYHHLTNENLGEESVKTFYRKDGNLHMDYLYTKPEIVRSFKIGKKDKYIGPAETDKSDHVPLIFEIDI